MEDREGNWEREIVCFYFFFSERYVNLYQSNGGRIEFPTLSCCFAGAIFVAR